MKHFNASNYTRSVLFMALFLLALLPPAVFPALSRNYHRINGQPSVRDGAIDLSGYDLNARQAIPLDGEWEFYYDRWLHSDPADAAAPNLTVSVPALWSAYSYEKAALPDRGKGSYRLLIRNCPGDTALTVYIPNISSHYRAYLNGELVSGKGGSDNGNYYWEIKGASFPAGSDVEIVVEMRYPHISGLYMTPLLAAYEKINDARNIRNIAAAACIGVMLVCIFCLFGFMMFKDKLLYSAALLVMDILVCLRFLVRDEFFDVLRRIVPVSRYYTVNSLLRTATFYLPFIFLLCISQLFHIRIRKRVLMATGLYGLFLTPVLFLCILGGRPYLQYWIIFAGYLPFLYIGWCLFREVRSKKPYSLLVSASFLFIMGSVISAALVDSGMLVMNISLYSPISFVLALLCQLMLFLRRSFALQLQAAETENLQLRLKDSETSLMLSQIQPHFLYNTLTAIHMLCLEEPEEAAAVTLKFAAFLRTNMQFIRSVEPIPFSQELEHVKNYLEIEKIRFHNRLTVCYEIESTGFHVPALTVQPLVENAVRHGACKNINGGSVTLRSCETKDAWFITVTDDGPGFDTKILETALPDSYGIANIVFRLREQLGAQVRFDSSPDRGTAVKITIPKGENRQ